MELMLTPLYDVHKALKARFVEFAGWEMPASYRAGLMEEHRSVRSSCGIFDVSHMGEIIVSGPRALEAIELVTTNRASNVKDWQCQYTLLCNDKGGILDDVVLYRVSGERFLLCVNASNREKVCAWLRERVSDMADVRDASFEYAQLAVQGPLAEKVLAPHTDFDLSGIKYYHFKAIDVCNESMLVSRTGYTGEDGFEMYMEPALAIKVWKVLFDAAKRAGVEVLPCGLGARDTLRLEAGYPLYGCELGEDATPIEAGLSRFVSFDKGDFIGRDALLRQSGEGAGKTLVGFEMAEDGIARQGCVILGGGRAVGRVTSGTFSPSLGRPIGMGYVEAAGAGNEPGAELSIEIRGRGRRARIVKRPFYRRKQPAGTS